MELIPSTSTMSIILSMTTSRKTLTAPSFDKPATNGIPNKLSFVKCQQISILVSIKVFKIQLFSAIQMTHQLMDKFVQETLIVISLDCLRNKIPMLIHFQSISFWILISVRKKCSGWDPRRNLRKNLIRYFHHRNRLSTNNMQNFKNSYLKWLMLFLLVWL